MTCYIFSEIDILFKKPSQSLLRNASSPLSGELANPKGLTERVCPQKMIFAVVARAARMRSAGAQHTCVPMRPPET